MVENKNDLIVGVSRDEKENLDYTRAARIIGEDNNLDLKEATELPTPVGWTYLIHGSNLDRPQWSVDNAAQLEEDTLILRGQGLSAISREDKQQSIKKKKNLEQQGITAAGYDTTSSYGSGTGGLLEIRVLFPQYHARSPLYPKAKQKLLDKYGEPKATGIMELCNTVWWKNHQHGRHPQLAHGMRLKKLKDEVIDNDRRIIQYVPELLAELYVDDLSSST